MLPANFCSLRSYDIFPSGLGVHSSLDRFVSQSWHLFHTFDPRRRIIRSRTERVWFTVLEAAIGYSTAGSNTRGYAALALICASTLCTRVACAIRRAEWLSGGCATIIFDGHSLTDSSSRAIGPVATLFGSTSAGCEDASISRVPPVSTIGWFRSATIEGRTVCWCGQHDRP